jgi:hypothetical protein
LCLPFLKGPCFGMKSSFFRSIVLLLPCLLSADDGIWLLNEFPRAALKAKYGFDASDEFLRKLQLGSVRFNNGGSGSFVSADGLVFTNHHVGADCIQKLSSPTEDYMKNGFLATSRDKEKKCPDLELNVLLKIENVTEKVKSVVPAGAAPAEAAAKRRAAMSSIEKACSEATKHRCDVVTLFSGGQYHLYEYEKYTDIRLVFAPEKDAAFFGGDPDNFTFPRWNLDITFFRVYEKGQPLKPLQFFPWSKQGARKGELQFVSGNPGSTGRLLTFAELELQRDHIVPLGLKRHRGYIDALKAFSQKGTEQARLALEEIFSSENSFKALSGFMSGLKDPAFLERKRKQESQLRAILAKDPEKQKLYGSAWSNIEEIVAATKPLYPELVVFENSQSSYGSILPIARQLYRYAIEKQKPNADRLREYSEAGLPSLEEGMFSTAPLDRGLEAAILAEYFRFSVSVLGDKNEVLLKVLSGRSPEQAASEIITRTKLFDVAERKRVAALGASIEQSDDALIALVRALDPSARKVRKAYEDQVQSRQAIETARLAQAQYSLGGNVYPDATFTMRVSFGPAIGYRNEAGKVVDWKTDFAGMYRHATGVDPLALPKRWLDAKSKLNLKMPFNYVTTADTHGGNSGSPTVNTKGEIVGILFDGNIEGLPNRYLFTDERARSVHVASQGIVEALAKVYDAKAILKELGFN